MNDNKNEMKATKQDTREFVVFRIAAGTLFESDMQIPKYIGEQAAIEGALKIIAFHYGDAKELLEECRQELQRRWLSECDGFDIYIRQCHHQNT